MVSSLEVLLQGPDEGMRQCCSAEVHSQGSWLIDLRADLPNVASTSVAKFTRNANAYLMSQRKMNSNVSTSIKVTCKVSMSPALQGCAKRRTSFTVRAADPRKDNSPVSDASEPLDAPKMQTTCLRKQCVGDSRMKDGYLIGVQERDEFRTGAEMPRSIIEVPYAELHVTRDTARASASP